MEQYHLHWWSNDSVIIQGNGNHQGRQATQYESSSTGSWSVHSTFQKFGHHIWSQWSSCGVQNQQFSSWYHLSAVEYLLLGSVSYSSGSLPLILSVSKSSKTIATLNTQLLHLFSLNLPKPSPLNLLNTAFVSWGVKFRFSYPRLGHYIWWVWIKMPMLRKFPAPMTVNAFTYMFGFIQVGLVGAVWEGNLKFLDFNLSSSGQVIAVLYAVSIDSSDSLKLIKKLLRLYFVHTQVSLRIFAETLEIKRYFGYAIE